MTQARATARLLLGEPAAAVVRAAVRARASDLRRDGIAPCLAIVSVGDDPASAIYIRKKIAAAAAEGVDCRPLRLPGDTTQADIARSIRAICDDRAVHGVILQLPVPSGLDAASLIDAIDPVKDVDGLHPMSLGLLAADRPRFVPATPLGVLALLAHHGVPVAGRHVAVVGRSALVGRSLAILLSLRRRALNATVTLCHSATHDLAAHTRPADVVVSATGSPGTIRAEHVAPGATVVDVGIARAADPDRPGKTRLAGDVAFDEVARVASAVSPVPGGVGPLTVACLLANTVYAADAARGPIDPVRMLLS